jgi:hypothetical protein
MPTFTITVTVSGNNVIVNPPVLVVQYVGTGQPITINWNASNCTFPTSGFFNWKSGSSPGWTPTRASANRLTGQYTAPSSPVTWSYGICVVNTSGTTLCLDPEIENERPPGDEDDTKDKNKDKDRD